MAIQDVNPTALIERVAKELEKEKYVKPTAWAGFVKTGVSRERAPMQKNWWFVRSAAILRKVYLFGPVGTNKLCVKFGGRKNIGVEPEHFRAGSGNHIRKILQQLESSGLVKKAEKGVHKGRVATPKGVQILDRVAAEMMKEQGIVLPKASDVKVEVPEVKAEAPKAEVKVEAPKKPRKKKEEVVANAQQ